MHIQLKLTCEIASKSRHGMYMYNDYVILSCTVLYYHHSTVVTIAGIVVNLLTNHTQYMNYVTKHQCHKQLDDMPSNNPTFQGFPVVYFEHV